MRFAVKPMQFFKVAVAGLAVARILEVFGQGVVELREARIGRRCSQGFLDLRESPADVPLSLGAPRLGDAELNELFPFAVLSECAETLGKTVAGIKI